MKLLYKIIMFELCMIFQSYSMIEPPKEGETLYYQWSDQQINDRLHEIDAIRNQQGELTQGLEDEEYALILEQLKRKQPQEFATLQPKGIEALESVLGPRETVKFPSARRPVGPATRRPSRKSLRSRSQILTSQERQVALEEIAAQESKKIPPLIPPKKLRKKIEEQAVLPPLPAPKYISEWRKEKIEARRKAAEQKALEDIAKKIAAQPTTCKRKAALTEEEEKKSGGSKKNIKGLKKALDELTNQLHNLYDLL